MQRHLLIALLRDTQIVVAAYAATCLAKTAGWGVAPLPLQLVGSVDVLKTGVRLTDECGPPPPLSTPRIYTHVVQTVMWLMVPLTTVVNLDHHLRQLQHLAAVAVPLRAQ